ncbi:MAG: hypothetical protein Q4E13_04805 [Clostridia bacterium]|nr:hypothetical protein [Clostridia bacterium]
MEGTIWDWEAEERDRRLVETAYQRLRIWREGCREIHDRAREARRIILLNDPRQDGPGTPPNRRTLQLQTLKSTVVNAIADQMDNMPEALVLPERLELNDVADELTDVMRFILAQNDYEQVHRRRVEDLFVTGTAILQVAWDPDMDGGHGNIAVIRWPVENFLWDPASADLDGARALFKVSWHPLSWFSAHYGEQGAKVHGEDHDYDEVGRPDAQEDSAADEEKALLLEYWYRTYDRQRRRYAVHCAHIAGGVLLEHRQDVFGHGQYPFIVNTYSAIEGMPVGEGMVQELAPMMRYVNRYAHYIDENLRMASKARMLVSESAQVDLAALTDWQNDVITGKRIDEDSVRWLQSRPFGATAAQQMLQMQTDMKQDSGQNQFTRGEIAGGVTAASAISALQEAGGKMTRLYTAVLNYGFRQMAVQILWLVNQFYGEERVRLITGRDGVAREIQISANHLMGRDLPPRLPPEVEQRLYELPLEQQVEVVRHTAPQPGGVLPPPPYSVQVQVQKRNPLRVQAQNELMIQAFHMAAEAGQPFGTDVLFEMMNVDGKEQILAALRQAKREMALAEPLPPEVAP